MKRLQLSKCMICGIEKSNRGFSQHIQKTHKIKIEDYIVNYVYDNIWPKCQCGCEQNVTIRGYQVMDYIDGHSPAGHFKKGEKPRRNYDKWKNNLTKGIQNYNKIAKQENPNYRSGENNNFFGRHHSESTKHKLRAAVEHQIKNGKHSFIGNDNGRIGRSLLEKKFEKHLVDLGIEYQQGYQIQYLIENHKFPRNKYYDFYIPKINTLIEIHGSYWHPQHQENLSEIQKGNLANDQFKKSLAKERWYNLLTIYDHELDSFINDKIILEMIKFSFTTHVDISFSGFTKKTTIELPEYWVKLVNLNTMSIHLKPLDDTQNLYISSIDQTSITINNESSEQNKINCFYSVFAERNDIEKLRVEE